MKLDPKKTAPPPVTPPPPKSMYAPLRPLPRPPQGQEAWPFLTGAWAGY